MQENVEFIFRGTPHSAEVFLSFEQEPYYIFCLLNDDVLCSEFGTDVTIKTDAVQSLPRRQSNPALDELRNVIFESVKVKPAFFTLLKKHGFLSADAAVASAAEH